MVVIRSQFVANDSEATQLAHVQPRMVMVPSPAPKPPGGPGALPDLAVTAPFVVRHYASLEHPHLRFRVSNLGMGTAPPFQVMVEILKGLPPSSKVSCWWLLGVSHDFPGEGAVGLHPQSLVEFDLPFPTGFLEKKIPVFPLSKADTIKRAVRLTIDPKFDSNGKVVGPQIKQVTTANDFFQFASNGSTFPKQSTYPVGIEMVGGEITD